MNHKVGIWIDRKKAVIVLLLGASHDNLPVVVELKAPKSNESPAQMLVQATAYALAVKKAWPKCLRSEWASALKVEARTLPRGTQRM
jgi:hypothetical protein